MPPSFDGGRGDRPQRATSRSSPPRHESEPVSGCPFRSPSGIRCGGRRGGCRRGGFAGDVEHLLQAGFHVGMGLCLHADHHGCGPALFVDHGEGRYGQRLLSDLGHPVQEVQGIADCLFGDLGVGRLAVQPILLCPFLVTLAELSRLDEPADASLDRRLALLDLVPEQRRAQGFELRCGLLQRG